MGREVKRVPTGFAWPQKKVWFGYQHDSVPCQLCDGTGRPKQGKTIASWNREIEDSRETEYCEVCEGEGSFSPTTEVPVGPAWQMWQTCSEGSPISPALESPEQLAAWLAANKASAFGDCTATYEEWLATIRAGGCCSAVMSTETGLISGPAATAMMQAPETATDGEKGST